MEAALQSVVDRDFDHARHDHRGARHVGSERFASLHCWKSFCVNRRSDLGFDQLSAFERHFFFNDTATTEIYTLSLHDALPNKTRPKRSFASWQWWSDVGIAPFPFRPGWCRSEEHTSELQSQSKLVCRLLL